MKRLLMLAVLAQGEGKAREVVFDESRAVEVRLAVADASRHATCVVAFPEESIEAIVASWNEGDLSLERRRENLFLKLFKKVEGDLHVVGASGTLYRLYLRPVEADADTRVRIVKPAAARKAAAVTSLELVRAMRRGEAPEWASVRSCERSVSKGERAEYVCRFVYEATHYVGYVVELRNVSGEPVRVDPSRFVGRDLVLVGAREMVVPAGASTLLYLVLWR
jgi:hypothetical protein